MVAQLDKRCGADGNGRGHSGTVWMAKWTVLLARGREVVRYVYIGISGQADGLPQAREQ